MFKDWKQHPVTQLVREHLLDFRESIAEGHTNAMLFGNVPERDTQIHDAGKCVMLFDVSSIEFDVIESFYTEEPEEGELEEDTEHEGY